MYVEGFCMLGLLFFFVVLSMFMIVLGDLLGFFIVNVMLVMGCGNFDFEFE